MGWIRKVQESWMNCFDGSFCIGWKASLDMPFLKRTGRVCISATLLIGCYPYTPI